MSRDELFRKALDGELSSGELDELEMACKEDPGLMREYERLLTLKNDLARLSMHESNDLTDRVMRDVMELKGSRAGKGTVKPVAAPAGRSWRLLYGTSFAAACAASALAGFLAAPLRDDLSSLGRPLMFFHSLPGARTAGPPASLAAKPECPALIRVRFVLRAPGARSVSVVGDFNGWSAQTHRLQDEDHDGVWTLTIGLKPGVYQYNLLVDGTRWVSDPAADGRRSDGFGGFNSVLRL